MQVEKIHWLVQDARPGDTLVFLCEYACLGTGNQTSVTNASSDSGHCYQVRARPGSYEIDGLDEGGQGLPLVAHGHHLDGVRTFVSVALWVDTGYGEPVDDEGQPLSPHHSRLNTRNNLKLKGLIIDNVCSYSFSSQIMTLRCFTAPPRDHG